jgi:hypothetical protein
MCWPGAERRRAPCSTTPDPCASSSGSPATDPHNTGWQRGTWVSFCKVASVLESAGASSAAGHWAKAHHIRSALDAAGKLPDSDRKFLDDVTGKLGPK